MPPSANNLASLPEKGPLQNLLGRRHASSCLHAGTALNATAIDQSTDESIRRTTGGCICQLVCKLYAVDSATQMCLHLCEERIPALHISGWIGNPSASVPSRQASMTHAWNTRCSMQGMEASKGR